MLVHYAITFFIKQNQSAKSCSCSVSSSKMSVSNGGGYFKESLFEVAKNRLVSGEKKPCVELAASACSVISPDHVVLTETGR